MLEPNHNHALRGYHPTPIPMAMPASVWVPCGVCAGQRRLFEPARNGEGLVPRTCPLCLGVGETHRAPIRVERPVAWTVG